MNCNGKRILVTGGAKGIGRALVATFLSEGAQVCVLDVDLEGMKVLENDFPEVIALECDVSDPEAVETSISSEN